MTALDTRWGAWKPSRSEQPGHATYRFRWRAPAYCEIECECGRRVQAKDVPEVKGAYELHLSILRKAP